MPTMAVKMDLIEARYFHQSMLMVQSSDEDYGPDHFMLLMPAIINNLCF